MMIETSTINQLIATLGMIISPSFAVIIGGYFYSRLNNYKKSITREKELLKDLLFYRGVIAKYVEFSKEVDGESRYNKFRAEVKQNFSKDFEPSIYSQPTSIKRRLNELGAIDKNIDKAIAGIKIK